MAADDCNATVADDGDWWPMMETGAAESKSAESEAAETINLLVRLAY